MPDFQAIDEDPGLDGPDYVALVIEWPEEAAPEAITEEITRPMRTGRFGALARAVSLHKATALGAAAVVVLAAWGIHRLRAAT